MALPAYVDEAAPAPGELVPMADGVFWVRMPLPFALDHINLWVLDDGDGWTLVDSGVNIPEIRRLWEQLLSGPLAGKPVRRLIVTHMHPDHFGLAGWFSERWRIPLWMTMEEFYTGRSMVLSTWDELPWEMSTFFHRAGLDAVGVREVNGLRYGRFADSTYAPPLSYRRIVDGEELVIGDRVWRVVVGRGHSPEHACLHCPELGLMISGDQVLPRISSNVSVFASEPEANPLRDWLHSLESLKRLPQDTLVLPAHGMPFMGLHDRLGALIHGHELQLQTLVQRCREPVSALDTLPVLFRRKLDGFNRLMAIGEALAHLHLLVDRGIFVAEDHADGVRRFRHRDRS